MTYSIPNHKNIIIAFLLLYFCHSSITQAQIVAQKGAMDGNFRPNGYLIQIQNSERKTIGSFYLKEEWINGEVCIRTKAEDILYKDVPFRYNLEDKSVEIKDSQSEYYIKNSDIKYFSFYERKVKRTFVNTSKFEMDTPSKGFFEILSEGTRTNLYSKIDLNAQKGNYVPALDAGYDGITYIQKESFYLQTANKVTKLPTNKKLLPEIFGALGSDIQKIVVDNKLSLKYKEDLLKIMDLLQNN